MDNHYKLHNEQPNDAYQQQGQTYGQPINYQY